MPKHVKSWQGISLHLSSGQRSSFQNNVVCSKLLMILWLIWLAQKLNFRPSIPEANKLIFNQLCDAYGI